MLATVQKDLTAGFVVSLVALPLCVGIALASGVSPVAGILSGILGGILVGILSGSHTSVTGPAAGLTAVVATQISQLGSFEAFLVAVTLAGLIQITLGACRAGSIATFFPLSVIKSLLTAIGLILILKQIPPLLGHNAGPLGEKSFYQPNGTSTLADLLSAFLHPHPGVTIIGITSVLLLLAWEKINQLKTSAIPAPVVVLLSSIILSLLLPLLSPVLTLNPPHFVTIPTSTGPLNFLQKSLSSPQWAMLHNPTIYFSALTIALVASLETLLNIEAIDKLDPKQRLTPPNRELLAQGVGNVTAGLLGALPMTSVIARSTVSLNARATTKLSTITHGILLLAAVSLLPQILNLVPLTAIAAILIAAGLKLASPKLLKQMWHEGHTQFLPFAITTIAIVATDLMIGALIGLATAIGFILHSNIQRPIRCAIEKHVGGDVIHITLANQMSFLSRASLERTLRNTPPGGHVLLNADNTDYIDADVLDLLTDFRDTTSKALGFTLSFKGFSGRYPQLEDTIQFTDYTSREIQTSLTPARVLQLLQEGNQRFLTNQPLSRDHHRVKDATSAGQFPMAAVLGCCDSRAPAEVIFDLGLGDVFSARVAGNIATTELLGSIEYACAVVGSKLLVVLGHTHCGAINAAIDLLATTRKASEATPCDNLDGLVNEVQQSMDRSRIKRPDQWSSPSEQAAYADEMSRRNVVRTVHNILHRSRSLKHLVTTNQIAIVGAIYDVTSGKVDFFQTPNSSKLPLPIPTLP
ncbi:MAG: hypothetical protein RI897_1324 [Verrucomicrobiota bacterium]